MSTLKEIDEINDEEYDDQTPQLFSQTSINHQNKHHDAMSAKIRSTPELSSDPSFEQTNHYCDDAVTSKNPGVPDTTSEDSTAAEEINSDDDPIQTADESPQYTSPSSEGVIEFLGSTQGKGSHEERVSRSIELNTNLVERALRTFSMSDPIKNREQGSAKPSQASQITGSAQNTDKNTNTRLREERNQLKQKQNKNSNKAKPGRRFCE